MSVLGNVTRGVSIHNVCHPPMPITLTRSRGNQIKMYCSYFHFYIFFCKYKYPYFLYFTFFVDAPYRIATDGGVTCLLTAEKRRAAGGRGEGGGGKRWCVFLQGAGGRGFLRFGGGRELQDLWAAVRGKEGGGRRC